MNKGSYADLAGETAVVTGGAKGIGAACVQALVDQEVRVAVLDTDADTARGVTADLDGEVCVLETDVSNASAVKAAFEAATAQLGPPTLLVNNAGIQHYGTVTETTEEDWDRVLGVNLKSAFLCAKEAIPSMQKEGGGAIVNVSSVQAFLSQSQVAPYTTSKTALLGLTRSIAVDYAPTIRCVAVCPGTINTPMLQEAILESPDPEAVLEECIDMHPVKRIGTPEEVANLIVYLLSDQAAFMTGQAVRIDGGLGLSIAGSKRNA